MSAATAPAPTIQTLEIAIAEAREVRREWHPDERAEFLVAAVPSARAPEIYTVAGHSHGRDATCTCWGFRKWKRCKHVAAFILIWEELERQHYANPVHSDRRLLELLDYYDNIADILNPEQRLRRGGIRAALRDRGISHEATRTLAEQAAVVRRGNAAKSELFGD